MALILWSGGCDSTLAAAMAIRNPAVAEVRLLSFNHLNIPQSKRQANARRVLLPKLKSLSSKPIVSTTVNVGQKELEIQACQLEGGVIQPGMWLGLSEPYLEAKEELWAGYCSGDCFWKYLPHFKTAFESLQRMRGARGKLRFPLRQWSKPKIIRELKALGLYEPCWFCESPINRNSTKRRACGRCSPCKRHIKALERVNREL